MAQMLSVAGIETISFTSGDIEEVLNAWLAGRLPDAALMTPVIDHASRDLVLRHWREMRVGREPGSGFLLIRKNTTLPMNILHYNIWNGMTTDPSYLPRFAEYLETQPLDSGIA